MPQQATTSIRFAPSDGESTPGAGHLCFPDGVITANLECLLTGGSNRSGGGHGISGTATTVTVRFTDPDGREADLSAQPCEGQCSDWPQADMVFGIPVCPAGDPCERLEFYGPTVIGHPDFCLDDLGARYAGSDCGYTGPDGDPWIVYTDSSSGSNPVPHTLKILWPAGNLWTAFDWPAPNYAFVPPLVGAEASTQPEVTMTVPSVSIRMPIRLKISKVGTPTEYDLGEFIREDSPIISGGDGVAEASGQDSEVWSLTDVDILSAIGTPDEGAIYEIYWYIYKGNGDITYQLNCDPTAIIGDETVAGEYLDRRGSPGLETGGFGVFETCKATVARVNITPKPLPFVYGNSLNVGEKIGESSGYIERTIYSPMTTSQKYWHGFMYGEPVTLSWSNNSIYAGGRVAYTANRTVYCATIQRNNTDNKNYLVYLTFNSGAFELWKKPLEGGGVIACGSQSGLPDPRSFSQRRFFSGSPSGNKMAYLYADNSSQLEEPWFTMDHLINGKLYEFDVSGDLSVNQIGAGEFSNDVTISASASCVVDDSVTSGGVPLVRNGTRTVTENRSLSASWNVLFSAQWNGETLEPIPLNFQITLLGSRLQTVVYDNYGATPEGGTARTSDNTSVNTLTKVNDDVIFLSDQTIDETSFRFRSATGGTDSFTDARSTDQYSAARYYVRQFPEGMINVTAGEHEGSSTTQNFEWNIIDDHFKATLNDTTLIDSEIPDFPQNPQMNWFVNSLFCSEEAGIEAANIAMEHLIRNTAYTVNDYITDNKSPVRYCSMAHDGQVLTVGAYNDNTDDYNERRFNTWVNARGGNPVVIGNETARIYGPLTPTRCLGKEEAIGDPGDPGDPGEIPTDSDLIAAHNDYRSARGLSILESDSSLTQAMEAHLLWMIANDTFSHTGEGGTSPIERAEAAGYGDSVGENLAYGHGSVADVMASWDGSPPHHANINDPRWTEIGVAIATRDAGGYWWGVMFGAP